MPRLAAKGTPVLVFTALPIRARAMVLVEHDTVLRLRT